MQRGEVLVYWAAVQSLTDPYPLSLSTFNISVDSLECRMLGEKLLERAYTYLPLQI